VHFDALTLHFDEVEFGFNRKALDHGDKCLNACRSCGTLLIVIVLGGAYRPKLSPASSDLRSICTCILQPFPQRHKLAGTGLNLMLVVGSESPEP
jgi:hypothetical protein